MNMSTALNRLRFALLVGALLFVLTSLAHGTIGDRIGKRFTENDGARLPMEIYQR